MRIVCLNPPFKTEYGRFSRTSRSPAITKSGTLYYPIWLCYVAGVLEKAGHDIHIIDSCAYKYDIDKTLDMVEELRPAMCVVDTSTPSIYSDIEIGKSIKDRLPDCFIVLIGTHPTALPEETLRLSDKIDAVAVGEADYTIKDLADKLTSADTYKLKRDINYRDAILGAINGLAYRLGNEIKINPRRELIDNLDELPFVSQVYHRHLDPHKYFFAASDYPEVQIMTARGCVAKCTFCVYPQTLHGWKYRVRSALSVADEFQWIVENIPRVREIGIEDDTFTGSRNRVVDFCKILLSRNIKIKWYCNVRADLKFETMEWMKKAGCVLVTVGYESANGGVLIAIDKRITPQTIRDFSHDARRAGLLVHGCFMAGNRGESRETLEETLNLALELGDDTMQFFPLMVYPGTKDYDWARSQDLLTIKNYSQYLTEDGNHNSVLKMPDMSSEEIKQWCDYARRRYYLRPSYMLYKLKQQVRHPSEIRRTFKTAKRFVKFLVASR